MLNDKLRPFYDAVNSAIPEVGTNAAKIADRVIMQVFPDTADAAEREGADKMLRVGVIARVTSILTKGGGDSAQKDFASISPDFMSIVDKLHSHSHYVPLSGVEQYVHVSLLIENPDWLDSARKYKRQKGLETLAEARVLDELYSAVTGTPSEAGEAA